MKCTPFTWRAFCPYQTTVQFNDASADRQPQAKSVYFPYEPSIDPMETLKDTLKVLGGNANAVITYPDLYHGWPILR